MLIDPTNSTFEGIRFRVCRGNHWISFPWNATARLRPNRVPGSARAVGFRPVCNERREG